MKNAPCMKVCVLYLYLCLFVFECENMLCSAFCVWAMECVSNLSLARRQESSQELTICHLSAEKLSFGSLCWSCRIVLSALFRFVWIILFTFSFLYVLHVNLDMMFYDVFYFLNSLSDPCLITLPCNSIQLFYLYCTYLSYMHLYLLRNFNDFFEHCALGSAYIYISNFIWICIIFNNCVCSYICICFGICICICTVLGPVTDHQSGWGHTLVTLGNRWQTPNRPLSHPLFLFSNIF